MRLPFRLLLIPVAALVLSATLRAEEPVMVSSVIFNNYTRARAADGTFKPEYYTFGEGGCQTRAITDPSMEKLNFIQIAKTIAGPLAKENYRPALSSEQAELLILVFWGATQGSRGHDRSLAVDHAATAIADFNRVKSIDPAVPTDPSTGEASAFESALWELRLSNEERDELDDKNARILGYSDALSRARFIQGMSMGRDVLQEISENRYYVVLQAYDFKIAAKYKKLKPLWTARISVSERGEFAAALDKMVWSAAANFGRESDGVRRTRPQEGKVELAPLQILEAVPAK
jgi:hypothetical protein